MRRALFSVVLAVGILGPAVPTGAQRPVAPVEVELAPTARLSPSGVITGRVKASCPADTSVLEALVTASQDDQSIFGQGSIAGPIVCDGRARWYAYRVSSQGDEPFHTGPAYVSAYLLVYDGNDTASDGDTKIVRVR